MKKFIFTLVIGILTTLAFPQSYHKLIRTNTYWDDYMVILPEMCYTYANRVFFTNQDTVINGFTDF
jgi:nicotinamide riboside transporter PnuC